MKTELKLEVGTREVLARVDGEERRQAVADDRPWFRMRRDFASEPGLAEPKYFGAITQNKHGTYNVHYYRRVLVPMEFATALDAASFVEGPLGGALDAAYRLKGDDDTTDETDDPSFGRPR